MATVYELAASMPKEQRRQMVGAGLLAPSIERYIYIYELWLSLLRDGYAKMDAYTAISMRCYTSEENVRKIIRKMSKEVK